VSTFFSDTKNLWIPHVPNVGRIWANSILLSGKEPMSKLLKKLYIYTKNNRSAFHLGHISLKCLEDKLQGLQVNMATHQLECALECSHATFNFSLWIICKTKKQPQTWKMSHFLHPSCLLIILAELVTYACFAVCVILRSADSLTEPHICRRNSMTSECGGREVQRVFGTGSFGVRKWKRWEGQTPWLRKGRKVGSFLQMEGGDGWSWLVALW